MRINLRKIIVVCTMLFLSCFSCITGKAETKKIGNFRYTYIEHKSSKLWITGIEPIKGKDVSTLKIPSAIDGKKVIKLGNLSDNMLNDSVDVKNIFGLSYNEDADGYEGKLVLSPMTRAKRVAKVRKIIIPNTVTQITPVCFSNIQDGKRISIPKGITKNMKQICGIKWKKVSISKENPKYKIKNNLLLSRNGKTAYGYVGEDNKVVIPKGVKKINGKAFEGIRVTDIYMPASLKKIEMCSLDNGKVVRFHVSKKNKWYKKKGDCIYNKKSGHLIAASVKNSTLIIPEGVTALKSAEIAGGDLLKKVVVPSSVKKIDNYWCTYINNIGTYVFKGKVPPKIKESFVFGVTFYVPKGYKQAYQKATEGAYGEVRIYEI